jgi:hypothetical protein
MLVDLVTGSAGATDSGSRPGSIPLLGNLATLGLGLVLVVAAGSRRIRNSRLLGLALVFEILLCFILSVSNPLSIYEATGALPSLTWVTPLIILFPLVVPCPPGRTLAAALVAAAMRPLGILLLAEAVRIPADAGAYLAASFSPALAVVMATFGSRVVYGLGLDVAAARRMGSYRLERLLGRGGMGEVWLARHDLLARPAALKLVRPEFLGIAGQEPSSVLRRFEREAQATAALRSPHTIGLYDFGIADDGTFYYVMELLDGLDMETLVKRFGPVPPARAVHLLRQVCHSLAEAHESGLVHRDIKPANLFVCRYGRDVDFIKVLDFGLVKTGEQGAAGDLDLTGENMVPGTPAYMAPERVLGRNPEDPRSDIYSVGCVAYWLLTGRQVFAGETPLEILMHHAQTAPTPPSDLLETPLPAALERLVLSCLEKDPARRPDSATALSEQLAGCAGQQPWTDSLARQWWERNSSGSSVA